MLFGSETEKELWRQAAVAALKSVSDAKTPEHREAMQYASFVADGIVRAYRKRCGEKVDEE
jgi:hypothetical protein